MSDLQSLLIKLASADDNSALRELEETFGELEPSKQFNVLFPLAISKQEFGKGVYGAAYLLHKLNPPCLISCEEAIDRMLIEWDVSIEEVPSYLADQFGAEEIERTLARLKNNSSSTRGPENT